MQNTRLFAGYAWQRTAFQDGALDFFAICALRLASGS
jgi:hypothetical protein